MSEFLCTLRGLGVVCEPVAAERGPGRSWQAGPALAEESADVRRENGDPIRIGYTCCSMHTQELVGQRDLLECAGCRRVFSKKISTRVRVRPELENALTLAQEIKNAAGDQVVILTVVEMSWLVRGVAV